MGTGLEITPTVDPFKVAIDDKLTVLVTENRKPKSGVPVAYQGETRGATGEDGRIAIRIRTGGMQLVSASIEVPLSDGKADTVIRATALQFELPK
jgi:nickel transport protein